MELLTSFPFDFKQSNLSNREILYFSFWVENSDEKKKEKNPNSLLFLKLRL